MQRFGTKYASNVSMTTLSPPQTAAPLASGGARQRLDSVDALRGAACLWVMLHHTFGYQSLAFGRVAVPSGTWHWPLAALSAFANIGWLGVNLFLVLSGFCLFYPLVARAEMRDIRLNLGQFVRRRLRRILPPYYAALLLLSILETVIFHHDFGVWSSQVAFRSAWDLLLHLLMLHNLTAGTLASVSPAFWSLALECQLYILFPILVWSTARYGLKSILVGTLTVAVVWELLCWRHLGFSLWWTPQFAVYYHALPGRAFEFAAGMAAAAHVARPRAGQVRAAWALVLLPLLPALYFVVKVSRFGPPGDLLWGVIFASLLVLLCRIPNIHFERHLLLKGFVWLGGISYSVYLIHQPLIWIISVHRLHCPPTSLGYYAAGLLRLPLLIGLGYLFHLAFERRFMPGGPKTERQAEIAAAVSPAP